jgi:hypothetical protein
VSWNAPILRLEVLVMFQHLTRNPYDEWKLSEGAVQWAADQAAYLKDYRREHAPRLSAQSKARDKRKRYNAGEAIRALVLAQQRARQQRYLKTEKGRKARARAQRQRRILRRARIAELAQGERKKTRKARA